MKMESLSALLRIAFYVSFFLLGIAFFLHLCGMKTDLLGNAGVFILLVSPIFSAASAVLIFFRKGNLKAAFFSFLVLLILIVNIMVG